MGTSKQILCEGHGLGFKGFGVVFRFKRSGLEVGAVEVFGLGFRV